MVRGQLVSSRRLIGRSGPKSGSAGSSWRPQLTQISAAPQTMAPVLQDKPRHSTDLAELYSPILWSVSSSSLRKITDTGTIFAIWSWRGPLGVRAHVCVEAAPLTTQPGYWRGLLSPVWPRRGGGALDAGPTGPYKVYGYFRYVLVMIPGMCYSPIPQSEVRSGS